METNTTQQLFFNHIKLKIPAHLSFVDEVAALLNISNDSAYRRIRGEKPIGLDEVQTLCNKYQVSLDQLLQIQSNTVIFSGKYVDNTAFGFTEYLQQITKYLEYFQTFQNPHIYYLNKDFPLFHYMQFPELMAFKFFFWKRTILGNLELAKEQFKGVEIEEKIFESSKKIIGLYNCITSTEVWNEENVHTTIRQIEYYRQLGIFANNQILREVYMQLIELLNHIEAQAEIGKKFLYKQPVTANTTPYHIYINECLIGDNTIFVDAGERQVTFLNHNVLNVIATQDKTFCDYTFKNIQNIIRKSTHVSVIGEKERNLFFNTLRSKIYDKMKNID